MKEIVIISMPPTDRTAKRISCKTKYKAILGGPITKWIIPLRKDFKKLNGLGTRYN